MRTRGPWRPSGRRFGSTGKIAPSGVERSQTRIIPAASLVGQAERLLLRGLLVGGLGDEDHVDVAGVVELAGAALPHRHDATEPGAPRRAPGGRRGRRVGRDLGPGDREGRVEDGVGEIRELGRDLVEPGDAGEVTGGQVQQAAAVGGGEQGGGVGLGVLAGLGGDRFPVAGVGADGVQSSPRIFPGSGRRSASRPRSTALSAG